MIEYRAPLTITLVALKALARVSACITYMTFPPLGFPDYGFGAEYPKVGEYYNNSNKQFRIDGRHIHDDSPLR
jgi:hypothetical protein